MNSVGTVHVSQSTMCAIRVVPGLLIISKNKLVGQRLSNYRKEIGSELPSGAAMNASEKQQNMFLILQVPLKSLAPPPRLYNAVPCSPMPVLFCSSSARTSSAPVDVESAIIKIGEVEGPHQVGDIEIERDPRFPVRVTMQYYKATSNGEVNDRVMQDVAGELQAARKWAVAISSLVTETTNRTTEHKVVGLSPNVIIPDWWAGFWLQYSALFPQYTKETASTTVFAKGRFSGKAMGDVQDKILDILGTTSISKPVIQPLPSWDIL